jgi:hypothetical protein
MRINERTAVVSAAICLAMASTPARADSFRCGTALIQEGMSSAEILVGITTTHYWYYERAQGQFVARVALREAIAKEIELLSVRDIESVTDDFG